MMTWDEFTSQKKYTVNSGYTATDITCPKCGKPIYKRTDIVLASYPPKYEYRCFNCQWSDYAY